MTPIQVAIVGYGRISILKGRRLTVETGSISEE